MSGPILATKLLVPRPRQQFVQRDRLAGQLHEGLSGKLTLISAPAGFGKTTLLSECARQFSCPFGWLSLDVGDNEVTRFLSYFISAIRTVSENFSVGIIEALRAAPPPSVENILFGLVNEIVEIQKSFVLVLDDYHVINNPEIHEIITFIVEKQPPQMHLVVSGRADPPWPLARWRARREMGEIRAVDLRFTPEEAETFLNKVMRLDLSVEQVNRLDTRTEGWIAGLMMAAISMQGREDISGFIGAFEGSHRFIFDFLVEEVLERLSPLMQDFLLKTSILEQLCAPLCDAVLDGKGSKAVLEQLEQMNLFIFPLDNRRYWYRYHGLFADLLVSRLTEQRPGEMSDLHRRASAWYEANNQLAQAVSHAFASGDIRRAARLAQADVLGIMDRGELALLIEWLGGLPAALIDDYPWLRVAQSWALAQSGSFDAALESLSSAEGSLIRDPDMEGEQARHIRGHIAAIRCFIELLSLGDYSRAARLGTEAAALLPASDTRTRGMVMVYVGILQRIQHDLSSALDTFNAALVIYRSAGQDYVVIDILSQMARVRRDQGLLGQAVGLCREALDIAARIGRGEGQRLPVAAYTMGIMGRIYYEWNQLDKAQEIGEQALRLSQRWGQANTLLGNHLFVAKIYRARGEFQRALESIQVAKDAGGHISDTHKFVIGTHEIGLRLAIGDLDAVEQWVKHKSKTFDTDQDERLWELAPLIVELYRVKRVSTMGDLLTSLDRMLAFFAQRGVNRRLVKANIQKAMLLQAQGQYSRAQTALEQALVMAEPEGYVRSFIEHGAPMEKLLRKAISAGIKPAYTGQLLAALQAGMAGRAPQKLGAHGPRVEALTKRESEVLRLLSAGMSVPEIASELVIADGTLRTHIKRIYRKLGVHSRFEAVNLAKELGLL